MHTLFLTYVVEKGVVFMITINQLREISMRYIDSQSIALIYMLKVLDEVMAVDNEILVYPKNLYCRETDLILYIFPPNYQLIKLTYDLKEVQLVTKNLRHLIKSEYKVAEEEHQLILTFADDEVIPLHPKKDTTLPYIKEFNSQLVLICRYLQEQS